MRQQGKAPAPGPRTGAAALLLIVAAASSSAVSVGLLLLGLLREGPAFYHGKECRMTYSHFQFVPLMVLPRTGPTPTAPSSMRSAEGRYRLLKFTDQRDPRHKHLYPISGDLVENYEMQNNPKRQRKAGRLLEMEDNWCLLPPSNSTNTENWRSAPHPHRGHPVLYVPGHWGSFSQARSIGAHGTRWTGQHKDQAMSDREIYESLYTGKRMAGGLDEFVMDVFALDFDGEGAALHASKLLRQAEFFARAVETIAKGCRLSHKAHVDGKQRGITIVAHSIGAWVVRIALRMHPHLTDRGWVRNVITLASPMASVPYAVDAGVHDIARHINDGGGSEGDVALISISGGLRDEMIPPEVCRIPTTPAAGIASDAFLASSIAQRGSLPKEDQLGMDHRAIVWCYDLLKVVREIIFSLNTEIAHETTATERLGVAQNILREGGAVISDRTLPKENDTAIYQDEVLRQHARLVQEVGYVKAVSVQLSAPYHLNSLLKLCIAAALLHVTILLPIGQRSRTNEMARSLIFVPLLISTVAWIRQHEFPSIGWRRACYGHECNLLLGSIFAQSQIATLAYLLVTYGFCTAVASIRNKISKAHTNFNRSGHSSDKSFGAIFARSCGRQLRLLTLVMLPSTSVGCVVIRRWIHSSEVCVWNRTSIAAYSFISCALLLLMSLVNLACKPSSDNSGRRSELLIIFLSLAKATYGKILYAFSLTSRWGQSDLHSYDHFLDAVNSHAGMMGGHHNEMAMCVLTTLLPAFLAMMAIRTHDIMIKNAALYWNRTKQTDGNGAKLDSPKKKLMPTYNVPKPITILNLCLVCWYTWNVSVNFAGDNVVIPVYSLMTCITTYSRCAPLSLEVMDVCSAIASEDLSLHCDCPKSHNKHE